MPWPPSPRRPRRRNRPSSRGSWASSGNGGITDSLAGHRIFTVLAITRESGAVSSSLGGSNPGEAKVSGMGDGDTWGRCDRGHVHWGRFGAAGLLVFHTDAMGEQHVL